ncbi:hypothetical protein WDU94_003538 [Cyamophila willieti]
MSHFSRLTRVHLLRHKFCERRPICYQKDWWKQSFRMAAGLESYVNRVVSIITADGRNFVGTLKGFDQTINIILDDSHERVYSPSAGVEQVVLGLHIIRGDNIVVVGELDEAVDSRLDLGSLRAEPLSQIVH